MNEWTSPIYVFFKRTPRIEYISDRQVHVFECAAGRCKGKNGKDVRHFLDKGDRKSTSNLCNHAKICWGTEAVEAADNTHDVDAARKICRRLNYETGQSLPSLNELGRGKLPLVPANIRRPKQGKVASACNSVSLLSQRLSLIRNCRAEIVRWVSENKHLFSIVKDRGFQTLMKTGRPNFHIPSPETVSRDVKDMFVRVRKHHHDASGARVIDHNV
jgi:hypothetical protein